MGEHLNNRTAQAHHDQPEPVILQQMVLMQRTAPDAIIIPGRGAPPQEYRLIIQVGKRSSTIGKRLQAVFRDGATATDVARAFIAAANYLLSVDQDATAFDDQPANDQPAGVKGNGEDKTGTEAQEADEAPASPGRIIGTA